MKQRNLVILGCLALALFTNSGEVKAEGIQYNNLIAGVCRDMYYIPTPVSTESRVRDIVQASQQACTLYQGYAETSLNIRSVPSVDGEVVGNYNFNDLIEYYDYSDEWVKVLYNGTMAYVSKEYISDVEKEYYSVTIPTHKDFKSYMPYTAIKSWKQKDLQDVAYTGKYGIRTVDDRYCVAVGTACNADVGTYIDLVLENGTVIPAIVGDIKANRDTQSNNLITKGNSCCSEFIVETSSLPYAVKNNKGTGSGSISSCCEEWNSSVVEIRVYSRNYFENE